MMTGGMVNKNAAVKVATSTKTQVGGGNPKFSAQTSAPKKGAKNKTQPAPKK